MAPDAQTKGPLLKARAWALVLGGGAGLAVGLIGPLLPAAVALAAATGVRATGTD